MQHKINRLLQISAVLFSLILLYSCDGLLDTEAAEDVDPGLVQRNLEGMESLSVSIHSRLRSFVRYGNELILAPDVLADNTEQHPTPSGRYDAEAINQDGAHFGLWESAYDPINEANYLIEGIDQLENVPDETRNRLLGEAYFLRGYAYHDLVKIFAYEPGREVNDWNVGVIIRTEPTRNVSDADDRPRSTNQEVYDLILSDMEQAITLLEGNDRGVYYANYEAALALMARIQLYLENWTGAVDYATQAINATDVRLVDQVTYANNMYESEPNPESIFEFKIDPNTESLGSNDAIDQYINPAGWFDVIPSQNLMNIYDDNDVRLSLFEVHEDGNPYITKFNGSTGTYTDHVPLIRYPELLLIRAEANAELGNETQAQDDLQTLQTARGLDPYSPTANPAPVGNDLIDEIMEERRREYAFEGHRWFDLKRRGMDIPKQQDLPSISYEDHRILAPIPDYEVQDFENVVQNPGY